jgi:SAM-dependent methyltransferase
LPERADNAALGSGSIDFRADYRKLTSVIEPSAFSRTWGLLRTEFTRTSSGLRASINENGFAHTVGRVAAVGGAQLAFPLTKELRRADRIAVRDLQLPYTMVRYNNSFLNERAVEISIARWFLANSPGRLLEVGNVLGHYGFTGHTVLDKYEVIPGVLNDDIVDFAPAKPFDAVIAISTLEHVGWDETPRDPGKVLRAIENLKKCVTPGGRILITVPIGHNEGLDAGLRSGEVSFPEELWLTRENRRNDWIQSDRDHTLTKRYGHPYPCANGLYVGMGTG